MIQESDAIRIRILEILSSIELVCNVWFLIEFVMKLVVAPQKKEFLKDPMNIIDILAIFPYWYLMIFGVQPDEYEDIYKYEYEFDKNNEKEIVWLFQTIRTSMTTIRILWIRSFYVHVMILALKYSFNQLQKLLQLFLAVSFILSGWCYLAEKDVVDTWYYYRQFSSIGLALYWAINTITTIILTCSHSICFQGKPLQFDGFYYILPYIFCTIS